MDSASDFGSEGCRFKSCLYRSFFLFVLLMCVYVCANTVGCLQSAESGEGGCVCVTVPAVVVA